jgi:hypothetical protein
MPLPGTVDETGQNFPKKPPNVFLGFCYAITNLGRPPELEHTINIPNMRDSHYALVNQASSDNISAQYRSRRWFEMRQWLETMPKLDRR